MTHGVIMHVLFLWCRLTLHIGFLIFRLKIDFIMSLIFVLDMKLRYICVCAYLLSWKCNLFLTASRCLLPAVTGHCKKRMPRWYYDRYQRRCTEFVYGGCGGNANNFWLKKRCMKTCEPVIFWWPHRFPTLSPDLQMFWHVGQLCSSDYDLCCHFSRFRWSGSLSSSPLTNNNSTSSLFHPQMLA